MGSILIMKKEIIIKYIILTILIAMSYTDFCIGQTLSEMADDIVKLNVFIEQNISKKEVYARETFVCDYYFVISNEISLTEMKLEELPSFLSFKSQAVNIGNINYKDTIIGNYHYNKALIHRYLLTTSNTGKHKLDGIKINVALDIPLEDKYKEMYSSQCPNGYYSYKTSIIPTYFVSENQQTNSLDINVIPLPNYKEKPIFVGDFDIDFSIDKVTTIKNNYILFNVNIVGNGNLSVPFVPEINKTSGLKVNIYRSYDTFEIIKNDIRSKKSYEINLLSSTSNEYIVAPIEILCFSPSSKEYYYLKTDAIPIFFTDGNSIKEKTNTFSILNIGIIIVVIGILIFVILAVYYSKRLVRVLSKKKMNNNTPTSHTSNYNNSSAPHSSDIATIYLSKAYNLIDSDSDAFLKEINIAINEFIKEHFQIIINEITKQQVVERLIELDVPSEIANNYYQICNKIEESRFAKINQDNKVDNTKLFIIVENYLNQLQQYI
jgi:hypothetical protein